MKRGTFSNTHTAEFLAQMAAAVLFSQFAWDLVSLSVAAEDNIRGNSDTPAYRYERFDGPANAQGIYNNRINSQGQVTGTYADVAVGPPGCEGRECSHLAHGFLYQSGTFTTLDVPGALSTRAIDINNRNHVTGSFSSGWQDRRQHGFLYSGGTFTTLDVPGADDTSPQSINDRGQVTGSFVDDQARQHGFIYSGGIFTTLDVPGARSTHAVDNNNRGEVTGSFFDDTGRQHGFIYSGGTFTIFDVPGADDMSPQSINDRGQVTGWWLDPIRFHGFVYSSGTITTLDVPGARSTSYLPSGGINNGGQVTGSYFSGEPDTFAHGFVYRDGTYITLAVPRAQGTLADDINDSGQVTGTYFDDVYDPALKGYGFIATPVASVLDDFNRENGKLGPQWAGSARVTAYKIADQRASVRTGGPVYWQPNPFGLDQEAFVTLARIDPAGIEQGLLMKAQGKTGNYRKGAIAVKYDANRRVVRVATWRRVSSSWRNYRNIPLPLENGDRLGARVFSDGHVEILHNGQIVGRVTLGPSDRKFFESKTGRIGLWFEGAPTAILDDFGGGTNMPYGST